MRMRGLALTGLIGALGWVAAVATPAHAVVVSSTWDWTLACNAVGACNDLNDTAGNTRTLTGSDTVTDVKATGWSVAGSTAAPAWLGQYVNPAGGLGVTNSGEDGGSNSHTVDNDGGKDFLVFVFEQPVIISQFILNLYANQTSDPDVDGDVSFWIGNVAGAFTNGSFLSSSIAGKTFADFNTSFNVLGGRVDSLFSAVNTQTTERIVSGFNPSNLLGNVLIIAPIVAGNDTEADYFKFESITSSPNPTPLPAGFVLLGAGLATMAIVRYRRRSA
jgi:hypothetical protein